MKTCKRSSIVRAAVIFGGLALVFGVLMTTAASIGSPFASQVMLITGSAVFGSGLTFFLIQVSGLAE